jgi:hypothetical protein
MRSFRLGPGNFSNQAVPGTNNVLSLPTPDLGHVKVLVESLVESEQQKLAPDDNVVLLPIVTGFSMRVYLTLP